MCVCYIVWSLCAVRSYDRAPNPIKKMRAAWHSLSALYGHPILYVCITWSLSPPLQTCVLHGIDIVRWCHVQKLDSDTECTRFSYAYITAIHRYAGVHDGFWYWFSVICKLVELQFVTVWTVQQSQRCNSLNGVTVSTVQQSQRCNNLKGM